MNPEIIGDSSSSTSVNRGSMCSLNHPLVRGQLICLLIAGTGVFATLLSDDFSPSANFPTFMNALNYLCLSVYMLRKMFRLENCQLIKRPWKEIELSNSLYFYLFAAFLDVEANFLVLTAYNYTSITSIMMLDCFTIPSALFLSYYFLQARYQLQHVFSIFICISGLACIVLSDVEKNNDRDDDSGSVINNAVLGDILCLCGSFLYACSNVLQEKVVKTQNREEYLGMLGVYGSCISVAQFFICDFHAFKKAHWNIEIILCIFGFVACLFCMYVNTSFFLQVGDSTFFNLSLLTSDVYAVIFAYYFFGELVHWLYFLGFGLVIIGLYTYYSSPKPVNIGIVDGDRENRAAERRSVDNYNPLSTSCENSLNVSLNGGEYGRCEDSTDDFDKTGIGILVGVKVKMGDIETKADSNNDTNIRNDSSSHHSV